MIYQACFITVEVLRKWSLNFAGMITGLKQSSKNKPRFF